MTRQYIRKTDGLRGYIWYQTTFGYTRDDGSPDTWTTHRVYLDHQTPRTDQDVIDVWTAQAKDGVRRMLNKPLPTMSRKVG